MIDINGIPFYSMGNSTLPDLNDGLLYHYTDFDGLIGILKSMSLRTSPLHNLNDLSEGKIIHDDIQFKERFDRYLKKCQILSFCRNYHNNAGVQEGTNRPRNWAHYADDCRGACVVIRSDKFLKENIDLLSRLDFHTLEKVDYTPVTFSNFYEGKENRGVVDFICEHYREVFFTKHSDWENEDESRLFCCGIKCESERYLSIINSIDSICLGERLLNDAPRMNKLVTVLANKRNLCYRHFSPHSFSSVSSSTGGYMTDGTIAASRIYDLASVNINRTVGLRIREDIIW